MMMRESGFGGAVANTPPVGFEPRCADKVPDLDEALLGNYLVRAGVQPISGYLPPIN
jgi:hypothetical protein